MLFRSDEKFEESINDIDLTFLDKEQEDNYRKFKESSLYYKTIPKIIITTIIIMSISLMLSIFKYIQTGQYELAFSCFIALIAGDFAGVIEIITQKHTAFKKYRGIVISAGIYFSCIYYASKLLTIPSILPG